MARLRTKVGVLVGVEATVAVPQDEGGAVGGEERACGAHDQLHHLIEGAGGGEARHGVVEAAAPRSPNDRLLPCRAPLMPVSR
jgi:hypothetical protein